MIDFKGKTLLVLAPHPDDETIGCSGLISKFKKEGGKVYVIIFTVGDLKQYGSHSEENSRLDELEKVMSFLEVDGFDVPLKGDDYHLKMDVLPLKDVVDIIETKSSCAISKIKPDVVAMPAINYNQDHKKVNEAGICACRVRPGKNSPSMVIFYEQISNHFMPEGFNPNLFVDITDLIEKKVEAIKIYKSQLHEYPYERSFESIKDSARVNGAICGVEFAEAYKILNLKI